MSTDTITLDIFITFAGYNSPGLSFWLEAQNGIAQFLTITSISWGTTFPDPTNPPAQYQWSRFRFGDRRIGWIPI